MKKYVVFETSEIEVESIDEAVVNYKKGKVVNVRVQDTQPIPKEALPS